VDFQQGSMSRDVEKSILLYLEKNLPKFHRLNLSWFGGEPLLCLETVLRLSCEIATLADRFGTRADFFITSNGYLLDPVTVKKLIMAGIRFFHVTVDGDAAYHDRFRVLADGSPSHAIIMMNILALLKNSPEAHLTLRMNADEENLSSFGAVLEMIPQAERGRVQVNIMPIIRNGETPSSSLFASINETLRDAQRMGYQYYDQRVPVGRGCFCNAEKLENFQIGPDGRLHKCSPSGKPEVQVGILDSEGTAIFNERFARWHSLPVIENQCRDCPYLCFCMGGCRLDRARGIHRASCKNRYLDINNIVINRYLALQNHDPFWQY
jgi:uncharacterized protein